TDRSKPADHNHAQESDRKANTKIFRINVADEIGKKASSDRRVKGADRKGNDLVSRGRNAERTSRNLALLDDEERTARAAAADIPGNPETERHQRKRQVIKASLPQFIAGDRRRTERKAASAIRQGAPLE